MKKFLAILLLGLTSLVSAQTTQTTPNLITSGTNHTWTSVTTGAIPSGCGSNGSGGCAGGPSPLYDPATNTIHFSYSNATVGQTIAINNALANVGAGVKVNGYNYSYDVRNMNGDNRQGSIDTFSVGTRMSSNTGTTLLQSQEDYNTKFDWTSFSSSKIATTAYELNALGNLEFRVTGADNGYWGGYFGPQVRNVNMSLRYTPVDPCIANPAANSGCPGYTTNIITSPNLLTTGSAYAINQALNLTGAGVMIHGFNYGYNYSVGGSFCSAFNQDGSCSWTMNSNLVVLNRITDNNNTIIYNQGDNYTTQTSGSKNVTYLFPTSKPITSLGNFSMQYGGNGTYSVTNRFSKAIYTPDFCAQNPTYSASCPGYNDIQTSGNLFTGTTGPQAYAINEALSLAGAGATVHGFNYGYNYNVAGRSCAIWDIFGLCLSGYNYSDAGVSTVITDNNHVNIYSESNVHNGGNNGTSGAFSKQFRFGVSRPISTLGGFAMAPWTSGNASITNMYSNAVYTADPCLDPLSSPSCPGYAAAYMTQQCTANPLYNSSCPGYAQAMFTQQCNANQMSNTACPGYAAAYLVQQCNANPLYSTTCSGYSTANSECSTNPLSHDYCPSYQTAQSECSSNPLYGSYCPSYTTASLECSTNPLSHSYCPTYQSATSSCSANSLTYSFCPGYTSAQTTCSTNPLSNSLCSNYTTASNSCSANALTASYCPGYTTALTTCSTDPLSNNMCTGYTTASTECSANQLSHSYCPSYQSSLTTCSTNPLSNSMCSGYQTATSSCSTNPLYASYCSGYQTALDTCSANPLSNTMCPTYQATTTQCAASPLTANYCPGYQFAYDCQQDGLYSKQCPNYSTAYAKKMLFEQQGIAGTIATAGVIAQTAPSVTTTTVSTTVASTTVSSDGAVSVGVSKTGDTNVDKAIAPPPPTANSAAAPNAPVQLAPPPPGPAAPAGPSERKPEGGEKKDDPKKDNGPGEKKEDKKEEGRQNGSSGTSNSSGDSVKPSDQPKSNREALAERRREAAVKEAVAKGGELAKEMGKAADLEAQKAVQNVVIAAMGFTPGFDEYNKAMLPDSRFYKPYVVYGGQVNVDNKSINRRLMGGSDRIHQEMVDSQYNREK